MKQENRFRLQVGLVMLCLLSGFVWFVDAFELDYRFALSKLPLLAGLELSPEGFIQGIPLTLLLCLLSTILAVVIGMLSALGRLSRNPLLYGLATFYNSFFKGTPLLVQILLIYLGLPQLGVVPTAIPSGVAALALCYGAYLSEVFRSAILSIHRGQWDAGKALGLKPHAIMRFIILPQAMKVAVPPTFSMFISMLKDSSLVSVMGLWELMFLAQSYGRSAYRYMEMLLTAAILYWLLSIVLELFQHRLESRLSVSGRR
ncbi:amino acid ABC transporter permease [Aquitalea sp. LB_tupeE]|uniref:amino acid ABC transporter permease n=1 Tax=Aquitalea sp. LB_tupeE TaxID=2748078 RepID=UPI0015B8B982|nr:amino acid ABC transporter permease [Aquitalea sp. LB_tupeE]NWK79861.1 amino acid ABC transporter permease [Aquitalea sp. LB_tupeE]